MRVVLDTNVFFSGFKSDGKPKIVVEAAFERTFTLLLSDEILDELEDVWSRKSGWHPSLIAATLRHLARLAEMVAPGIVVTECRDPDDNRVLEAAVAGAADCIVSGDKHLLRMKEFRGIEILTVSNFLQRIGL